MVGSGVEEGGAGAAAGVGTGGTGGGGQGPGEGGRPPTAGRTPETARGDLDQGLGPDLKHTKIFSGPPAVCKKI